MPKQEALQPDGFDSLVYPNDMSLDNFYPDCICFTFFRRRGVSIDTVKKAAAAAWAPVYNAFENSSDLKSSEFGKGLKEQIDRAFAKAGGKKKFKPDDPRRKEIINAATQAFIKDNGTKMPASLLDLLKKSLADAKGVFAAEQVPKRQLKRTEQSKDKIGSIYLNMPNAIQFAEGANWGGESLGFIGKMAKDFIGGSPEGSIMQGVKAKAAGHAGGIAASAIGVLPTLFTKLGLPGGMFGAGLAAATLGPGLQKGAESALGVAQNPYMEMLFSGVGFRKYSFDFILRPKSSPEIDTVVEIIRMFRTYTKPRYTEQGLDKHFMDYPMEVGIEFLTSIAYGNKTFAEQNYVNNPYVPKIKNCVCDNVTTNYTPQSVWASHAAGAPVAIGLALSFQETELVMADDVFDLKKGY